MRPQAEQEPRIADAFLLGLIHGPAELLPISSSGHATLIPWFAGLPYAQLDPKTRKPIEVALHAGTAAALILCPPRSPVRGQSGLRALALSALTLAPTAAVGLAVKKLVKERLGTPATVASGLGVGAIALLAADRVPGRRGACDQTARDALILGVAQSAALWPGVSRSTAMLATARGLQFAPPDAARIARSGLVPAALAATALESVEWAGSRSDTAIAAPIAVAATTSFLSTLAARPLVRVLEGGGRLWPWAVWRLIVAALTFGRIRSLSKDAPDE